MLDTTGRLENQAADVGSSLFSNVQQNLSQPLSYAGAPGMSANYDALRNSVYDASMARANQDLDRQGLAVDQRLANQGIAQGTDAAKAQQDNINRARVDAGNQAWIGAGNQADQAYQQELSRRQQGIGEITSLREAPINEVSGLFGLGGGVQNPQFQQYHGAQVAPTDVLGAYNSSYAAQQANYQNQMASRNAAKGGLGSLIGTGAGLAFRSDRRVKRDIKRVGTLDNGLNVYVYRFKDGGPFQIGVIAQEVAEVNPEAVMDIGGILHVDYAKAVEA